MTDVENPDDIEVKHKAMKTKLNRFMLKDIVALYYPAIRALYIQFVDKSGHMWGISSSISTENPYIIESDRMMRWVKNLIHRNTTTNLINRYRMVLKDGYDYAMCFDVLMSYLQHFDSLNIIKLSNFSCPGPTTFKFFTQFESVEEILIQYDLYRNQQERC